MESEANLYSLIIDFIGRWGSSIRFEKAVKETPTGWFRFDLPELEQWLEHYVFESNQKKALRLIGGRCKLKQPCSLSERQKGKAILRKA